MDTMVWDLLKEIRLHDGLSCDLPISDTYKAFIVALLRKGFDDCREVMESDIDDLIQAVRLQEGINTDKEISDTLVWALDILLDTAYHQEEEIRELDSK